MFDSLHNSAPTPLLLHNRHFHYTIMYTIEHSMVSADDPSHLYYLGPLNGSSISRSRQEKVQLCSGINSTTQAGQLLINGSQRMWPAEDKCWFKASDLRFPQSWALFAFSHYLPNLFFHHRQNHHHPGHLLAHQCLDLSLNELEQLHASSLNYCRFPINN